MTTLMFKRKNEEIYMAGIDKNESILLIEHAISAFKNQDKTQSDLADFLGTDATRLSEGKKGNWRLMPSHRNLIIQEFGYPRQGKGIYVNSEHYSTVDQFIGSFHDISDRRFYQRLSSTLRSEPYMEGFLKNVWLQSDIEEDVTSKVARLNEFINTSDFESWFHESRKDNSKQTNLTLTSSWKECGFIPIDGYNYESLSSYLFRVGILKFCSNSCYQIGTDLNENLNTHEFVLTGDVILETEIQVGRNHNLQPSISIPDLFKRIRGKNNSSETAPDIWSTAYLYLFLSESMRYNAHIRLKMSEISDDYLKNQRDIVIEDLDQTELSQEIEKLRKFLGESFSYENSIKYNIAVNGGYVPGAKRL